MRFHPPDARPARSSALQLTEAPRLTSRGKPDILPGLLIVCLALMIPGAGGAQAQSNMGGHQPKTEGQRIYEKANCVGCHKWHGGGGGGYGGAALSLRDTQLDRQQIVEAVHCGRPATAMPRHDRAAYNDYQCFGGMTLRDLGKDGPAEAANFLRPQEIEIVVDYVLEHIKGKGLPSYRDCTDFFGEGARACDTYRNAAAPPADPVPRR
jgi:mono/diheme cytochrome c family protein